MSETTENKPETPQIPLGKHTFRALVDALSEIRRQEALLQEKQAALRALMVAHGQTVNAIMLDQGFDPAVYPQYELAMDDGAPVLILKPKE